MSPKSKDELWAEEDAVFDRFPEGSEIIILGVYGIVTEHTRRVHSIRNIPGLSPSITFTYRDSRNVIRRHRMSLKEIQNLKP